MHFLKHALNRQCTWIFFNCTQNKLWLVNWNFLNINKTCCPQNQYIDERNYCVCFIWFLLCCWNEWKVFFTCLIDISIQSWFGSKMLRLSSWNFFSMLSNQNSWFDEYFNFSNFEQYIITTNHLKIVLFLCLIFQT